MNPDAKAHACSWQHCEYAAGLCAASRGPFYCRCDRNGGAQALAQAATTCAPLVSATMRARNKSVVECDLTVRVVDYNDDNNDGARVIATLRLMLCTRCGALVQRVDDAQRDVFLRAMQTTTTTTTMSRNKRMRSSRSVTCSATRVRTTAAPRVNDNDDDNVVAVNDVAAVGD